MMRNCRRLREERRGATDARIVNDPGTGHDVNVVAVQPDDKRMSEMKPKFSEEKTREYPKELLLLHKPRIAPAALAPNIGLPLARDNAWNSNRLLPEAG